MEGPEFRSGIVNNLQHLEALFRVERYFEASQLRSANDLDAGHTVEDAQIETELVR
jgi:hypothetical protein